MKSGSKTCRVGTVEVTHKGKRRGRPKMLTPEEFQEKAEAYFEECRATDRPLTISGMTFALGFKTVQSLYDYMKDPDYETAVARARLAVEVHTEEGLITGDIPAAAGIFTMKARFGLADKQVVDHQSSDGSFNSKEQSIAVLEALKNKHKEV